MFCVQGVDLPQPLMGGLRETLLDDDQLLVAASAIFDGLLNGYVKEEAADA